MKGPLKILIVAFMVILFSFPGSAEESVEKLNGAMNAYIKKRDYILTTNYDYEKHVKCNWRAVYGIYKNYERLENLAKGVHPMDEEKYRDLKEMYEEFSMAIRSFNAKKRMIEDR